MFGYYSALASLKHGKDGELWPLILSFRNYWTSYDEIKAGFLPADGDYYELHKAACTAAQYGHLDLLKHFVSTGRSEIIIDLCLEYAGKGGHMPVVEYLISEGADDFDVGLEGAAESGDQKMIDFFINKGAENITAGFIGACNGKQVKLAKYFIDNGLDDDGLGTISLHVGKLGSIEIAEELDTDQTLDWELVMESAAEAGNIDLVHHCIYKGANNWYNGMMAAVTGGHMNLVELFESKEDDWEYTDLLCTAVSNGRINLVNYLLTKCDHTELYRIWPYAIRGNDREIIDMFMPFAVITTSSLCLCLSFAAENGNNFLIKLLREKQN